MAARTMAGVRAPAAPLLHSRRLMTGGGFWRRRATVKHQARWYVISFAADGSTLEACAGERGCTETRVRRAGAPV